MRTIGEVARQAQLSTETIRYYERQGLIPEPARSANGYRKYPTNTTSRLAYIKRAKTLGFSLREIRDLLKATEDESASVGDIKARAQNKLLAIENEIANLKDMHTALSELVSACPGNGIKASCPILGALGALSAN